MTIFWLLWSNGKLDYQTSLYNIPVKNILIFYLKIVVNLTHYNFSQIKFSYLLSEDDSFSYTPIWQDYSFVLEQWTSEELAFGYHQNSSYKALPTLSLRWVTCP